MNQKKRLVIHPARIGMYVFAIIWTINCLFPLGFTLMSSFKTSNDIFADPFSFPTEPALQNYVFAWSDVGVMQGVINSIFYSLLSTLIILVLALLASYALTRMDLPFANKMMTYYMLGITIPIYATLLPLSNIMTTLHIRNTVAGIVLLYVAVHFSFAVFTISGFMRSVSRELDESARIDGCGTLRLIFQILGPLTLPAMCTCGIITFLQIYNDLILSVLFLTKEELATVSIVLMRFKADLAIDYGGTFAGITIAVVPLVVIYIVFQKRIEGGLTEGAVKG